MEMLVEIDANDDDILLCLRGTAPLTKSKHVLCSISKLSTLC